MCEGQTFRAFVNERLAAAAGELRALFERTAAQCEEELRRSEEENQRKQRRLDQILSPRVILVRARVQTPPTSPGPRPNQGIRETPRIKLKPEEQRIKQEEEQLPVCFPDSSGVCVKREALQQKHTERRNISSEPHFHSVPEGHTEHSTEHSTDTDDEDWEPPFKSSEAQMETEDDGDHHRQVQSKDRHTNVSTQNKSGPETSARVNNGETSRADGGDERKKHQCHVCNQRFSTKQCIQIHTRVHTGERPFKCSTCDKTFTLKCALNTHKRTHTGERPYKCSTCDKTFTLKCHLNTHRKTHTGERPFMCSTCDKTFKEKYYLNTHRRETSRLFNF